MNAKIFIDKHSINCLFSITLDWYRKEISLVLFNIVTYRLCPQSSVMVGDNYIIEGTENKMKCKSIFVFKTLTLRKAGTFKNNEGVDIEYPAAYILKADEILDNGDINEHKFKIDNNKTILVNTLKELEPYQKIYLTFEVTLFLNKVGLEVVDVDTNMN